MAIATLDDAREVTSTIVQALDPLLIDEATFSERLRGGSPFLSSLVREELRSAEYLARGGFAKEACYHAQQAVEKACKARLLGRGWLLEKAHSIRRLAALAADYRIEFPLADAKIDFIDAIYRGRDPGEAGLLPLGEPTDDDARRAIEAARTVLDAEDAGGRT